MGRTAVLQGLGAMVPSQAVTNAMLAERLDTSDEWIRRRTGIGTRYAARPGTATSDLAVAAGERALQAAGVDHVELVVLATTTPDHPCPATAPRVASLLGLGQVPAYDVAAVCTGFVYALAAGVGAIAAGLAPSVLVIGADTFTSIVNPADRTTAVIFGDGAGAAVLRAGEVDEPGALLGFDLGSDGSLAELITVRGGGSRQKLSGAPPTSEDAFFTMEGRSVFRAAVEHMAASSRALLKQLDWDAGTIDHLVGHQANERILNAVADEVGVDRTRAIVHLDRVGNTSAASIPLALVDGVTSGRIRPDDRVLLTAFGGGITWGSCALVWPEVTAL